MSVKTGVVIPCYNHEQYVERAIESVLNQTRPVDKLLIIDDGSRDDSVGVLNRYAKEPNVDVITQKNAGAHNTINRAVSLIQDSCDLIGILNSDDHYVDTRFEECVPYLEKHSEKSVLCTGLTVIDDDDKPLAHDEPRAKWFRAAWSIGETDDLDLCEWLGMANFPATTSNIIARSSYLKSNPFRPYRFNHDYYFLAIAVLRGELALKEDSLVNYRVHGTNTINTAPAPLIKEMLRMHLDIYNDMGHELAEDAKTRERFYSYMRAAWDNISSFHSGLFQLLVARLAMGASEDDLEKIINNLQAEELPELESFPNRSLVNTHDGVTPLSVNAGLTGKYETLRLERRQLKEDIQDLKAINRLRTRISSSKWLALGRIFGAGKSLASDNGSAPREKLTSLSKEIAESTWLKVGASLGASDAKFLREFVSPEKEAS